jgi:hypothetical protein
MALDTLAKIIGTALVKLGDFAQYIQPNELEVVAFDRLAYYLADFRESDQNQRLKSLDFSLLPDSNSVDLQTLAGDIFSAAWVEARIDQGQTRQIWQVIPTVNLDTITDYADRGEFVCAFSGQNIGDLTVTFSYYGDSQLRNHRLRYDANITLPGQLTDVLKLPDNLASVIVYDIAAEIIPFVELRIIDLFAENEAALALKLKVFDSIKNLVENRRDEWRDKWENYKLDANRSQRGMKRPKYLSSGIDF